MHARQKGPAVGVLPWLSVLVALVVEEGFRAPVLRLLGQVVAALKQEDARAAVLERVGERAPARAGPDDDQILVLLHVTLQLPVVRRHGASDTA